MQDFKFKLFELIFLLLLLAYGAFAQKEQPETIRGGILNGKAVNLPKPLYPDEARIAKVGGEILVEVIIDEGGNVISADIKIGHGEKEEADMTPEEATQAHLFGLLRSAAIEAARQAQFSPTLLNGSPVKVSGEIVYNFVLDKPDASKAIKGGVLNGKALSLPHPEYPPAAKAVGASGAVSVQVLIDESGDVISAQAVSGHPLLQAAAVRAALGAKFLPTLLNGEPVKVSGILTYNFQLPKKEIPASGAIPMPG